MSWEKGNSKQASLFAANMNPPDSIRGNNVIGETSISQATTHIATDVIEVVVDNGHCGNGEQEKPAQKPYTAHVLAHELSLLSKPVKNCTSCIYKLPQSIRKVDINAFTPRIVSIGPFHCKNQGRYLKEMEGRKLQYLQRLMIWRGKRLETCLDTVRDSETEAQQCYSGSTIDFKSDAFVKKVLEPCFDIVKGSETKARQCYSGLPIGFQSDDFVKMMLLDCCFLIALFLMNVRYLTPDKDDPIFNMLWVMPALRQDLLLLENQIPFFMLKALFYCICTPENLSPKKLADFQNFFQDSGEGSSLKVLSLEKLALHFFQDTRPNSYMDYDPKSENEPLHLLHLFYTSLIPENMRNSSMRVYSAVQRIPCITKLRDVGLKLGKCEERSFLDIKFNDGILEIPPIKIQNFSCSQFLNLIAFEQCYHGVTPLITAYALFMDCLIDSSQDVKLLCQNGIIKNWLRNDDEAVNLVNKLQGVVNIQSNWVYLAMVFAEVNEYCNRPSYVYQVLANELPSLSEPPKNCTSCIYKLPKSIHQVDINAFMPCVVSIGPFHHSSQRRYLKEMEGYKLWYLQRLMTGRDNSLVTCLHIVKGMETEARQCYSGSTIDNFASDDFVKMMLLDCCFLIALFLINVGYLPPEEEDPIFNMLWVMPNLRRDLLLLENQIPFFMLKALFDCIYTPEDLSPKKLTEFQDFFKDSDRAGSSRSYVSHGCLHSPKALSSCLDCLTVKPGLDSDEGSSPNVLTLEKLALYFLHGSQPYSYMSYNPDIKHLHLLHLFYNSLIPVYIRFPSPSITPCPNVYVRIPCITKLMDAGLQLRKCEGRCFLDIKFNHGTLEIPPIKIQDFTCSQLLNLIAFEQCYHDVTPLITAYALFMDCLIDSAEDVKLLCHKEVINNCLRNDDKAVDLVKKLQGVVKIQSHWVYLATMFEKVNEYCNLPCHAYQPGYWSRRWNVCKEGFTKKYHKNPLAAISLVAASLLLILTMAQTPMSYVSYFLPPH